MKIFKKIMPICMAALICASIAACSDANEYEDTNTANPSWVDNYDETQDIPHPETLAGTKWVRTAGIKRNVYGEEIQGFVESIHFISEDAVEVKMSQGTTEGTWIDDSNTEHFPTYRYAYNAPNGKITIDKRFIDDDLKVTYVELFLGTAVSAEKDYITIVHFGDIPAQTYLVKQ